jgi:diacylglycerol O-acyltransferase
MDRVSGQDLWSLIPDEFGWPQDIGAVGMLAGDGVAVEDLLARVRDQVQGRLHLVPRLRQLIRYPPLGLGLPVWVDARIFHIEDHVRTSAVGPGGDEADLLRAIEELHTRPLDRSRPLWQLWLLPGLSDGRVGMYFRLHHSIADGVAGVATMGALLDLAPEPPSSVPPPWTPEPLPTIAELHADVKHRRERAIDRTLSAIAHPAPSWRAARALWPQLREVFMEERAPRTSLNRPIGHHRRLALVRGRLDLAKQAAHAHGGKVNDVVLAAVTGGLRDLLVSRGENVQGLQLRAGIAVSLHRGGRDEPANFDGAMAVPLPVGEPDPVRRLRMIAFDTAERKKRPRPHLAGLFGSPLIARPMVRRVDRQRLINIYVANVPGPPVPVYLAGRPLLEVFPLIPIMGNCTVGVGVLSYAGQLNFTVVADTDTAPDVAVLAEGVRNALEAMAARTNVRALRGRMRQ